MKKFEDCKTYQELDDLTIIRKPKKHKKSEDCRTYQELEDLMKEYKNQERAVLNHFPGTFG